MSNEMIETSDLQRRPSVNSVSEEENSSSGKEEDQTLGNETTTKKETKDVLHLKLLVLFILVASASIIASCVFVYITSSETSQFEAKYNNDAEKVFEAIGSSFHRTLGLLDSVSVTLVSYARDQNHTWPFVTLPDFGARMAKLLPLTDAFVVQLLPIIRPEKREQWEAYSVNNDYWVNQNIALQETWSGYYGPTNFSWEPRGTVFGDSGDIERNISRIMIPTWQSFPTISTVISAYNWDYQSMINPAPQNACISGRRITMSRTYMIPNPNDPKLQAESEGWIDWIKDYIPPDEIPFEPVVDMFYPVMNDIDQVDFSMMTSETTSNETIVALLAVNVYWRNFIRNILPPGSNGIVVVIESPCNEMFSYEIDGPEVKFLGVGDAHDAKYQQLARSSKFADLKKFSLSGSLYSGAPMDEDICPYTIHLYPSDLMKSDFTTNNGVIFMVSTICIFLFTSLVFYLYDKKVERRQNRVATTANRSSALLSSLFPATVRDQLYQTQGESKVVQRKWGLPAPFLDNSPPVDPKTAEPGTVASAIAQLYTDTTVIFMDIVGFTEWSATRQPTEVFQLLETIYGRFDAIAKVHGVFKIETIGDSYVAVVGLPTKRKRHAVIMAKFAYECRENMKEVATQLEETLGQGTSDLRLRIGINSGPTTAGVLRGEKARFQLFGDTVNTAARMESNSAPNKIQVSESTATLIQSAGYGSWLTERPDQIMAKGKGLMQTYWCEPIQSHGKSTVVESSNDDMTCDNNDNVVDCHSHHSEYSC